MIVDRFRSALPALIAVLALSPMGLGAQEDSDGLPLQPERWARFTTSEGTWISLDVSPDGQTIVFDLLGDIYTIPIAGGAATRLTSGIAHDMQPRYSPDGSTIVFVSDRSGDDNVWLMAADGSDLRAMTHDQGVSRVFNVMSPEWTPDGQYVVVSRQRLGGGLDKLWLYHRDGGTGIEMTPGPGGTRIVGAAMGPDPRYVWYAQRQGTWSYNGLMPQYQVGVYDRHTGTRTTMTSRYGSAFRPAVSPDGRWLTYGTRHDAETGMILRELATGEERWLAYPIQRDEQESRASMDALPGYSFTPDSRAVVMSYGGKIWSVPIDGSAPTEIPFTVEAEIPVGPEVMFDYPVEDSPTFTARQIRNAVPSPDGSQVAFTALDRLYVMNLADGNPRRVTQQEIGEFYPAWSPDGRTIAFTTWNDTEGHIMSVRASGGNPRQLTTLSGYYQELAWSPDGERIVAVRSDSRNLAEAVGPTGDGLGVEFVWIPADGGEITSIGPTQGRSRPHFSGDSERIYSYGFTPGVGGNPPTVALASTRWDNTDLRMHLRVTWELPIYRTNGSPGADTYDLPNPDQFSDDDPREAAPTTSAGFVMMAPQGDWALAQAGAHIYAVKVPVTGGPVPVVTVSNPDSASMPMRKLTDIGGEFPTWGADGRTIHWSLGNAFASFDLDRAQAVDDSLRAVGADSATTVNSRYTAQEQRIRVEVPRDIPQGTVVLRGARIITMNGDEVIENGDIVIEDNRITSVGPQGATPAGAEVIDVSGKTIVPGFVDVHAHMWNIWGTHWSRPWIYQANLAYGVTTTRDPQTATTDVLTYADMVRAGRMPGPRVYSTGPGVFWPEGVSSLEDARHVLTRYSDYYDTKTFKMYAAGDRRARQFLIMAARELELMPTTEGSLDYRLNMTHAMDGYPGIEHNMPIVPAYRDVIELFLTSQTTNTPTLLVNYGGPWAENYFYTREDVAGDEKLAHFTPAEELNFKIRRRNPGPGRGGWFHEDEYAFPRHAAWLSELLEAGGRAGVGSHGQLQGLGFHWELWAMQSGGMDNHDALRSATILGAEAIGLGGDLGSIEVGKLADLVILDANPLDEIRNTNAIDRVVINGRIYDGDTLDEQWPRQISAPVQYWQNTGPNDVPGLNGGTQ